jgi:hypothetical protein
MITKQDIEFIFAENDYKDLVDYEYEFPDGTFISINGYCDVKHYSETEEINGYTREVWYSDLIYWEADVVIYNDDETTEEYTMNMFDDDLIQKR